ncbi:MAG: hypothetical protein ACKV1O_14610 [Saprospiraceae bacterium]
MERYLPDFTKERKVNASQSENDLTEQLYLHLTRKAKFNPEKVEYNYVFQPEKSQRKKKQKGHPKRMDIAARLNTFDVNLEAIYCLEAKKLPTPGSGREKEYISGKGGAIERFKNEAHGLDDAGNLLENNGIVAYVTENSFVHWQTQINQWVSDVGWSDSEKLAMNYFAAIGKLTSQHQRISGSTLNLDHFWMIV